MNSRNDNQNNHVRDYNQTDQRLVSESNSHNGSGDEAMNEDADDDENNEEDISDYSGYKKIFENL